MTDEFLDKDNLDLAVKGEDAAWVDESANLKRKPSFDYKYSTQIMAVVIIAMVAAILLRAFVFPSIVVCGSSMNNTLYGGVDVNGDGIEDGGDTVLLFKTVNFKRGDIIVFHSTAYTLSTGHSGEKNIIKRVIATGGQTVKLEKDGDGCSVYVDGELLSEDYLADDMEYKSILFEGETAFSWTVPENCLFVMGDNRNISGDSRYYGYVSLDDKSEILGKAVVIFNTGKGHAKLQFLSDPY